MMALAVSSSTPPFAGSPFASVVSEGAAAAAAAAAAGASGVRKNAARRNGRWTVTCCQPRGRDRHMGISGGLIMQKEKGEELRRTLGVVPSVSSVGLKSSEVPFIQTSRDDGRKSKGVC